MSKFSKWLENRDPDLHGSITNEVNWLNALGIPAAVATNLMALANANGLDFESLAKNYAKKHNNAAMHAPLNPGDHGGHTSNSHGSGPGPDPHGHGHGPNIDHGHGHDDHGHGHDHTDHLHAHLFGDKQKEDEEERIKHFYDKLGPKKGTKGVVTLPVMKPGADGPEEEDDGGQDFGNIPHMIKVPGQGMRPGINPISVGQAQYNQMMAGQKPNVPQDPFDFSGEAEPAPVNPMISKFAARMQKARQMRQG